MKIARDRREGTLWLLRKELRGRYYSAYEPSSLRKIRFQKPYIARYLAEPIELEGIAYLIAWIHILARSWSLRADREESTNGPR